MALSLREGPSSGKDTRREKRGYATPQASSSTSVMPK